MMLAGALVLVLSASYSVIEPEARNKDLVGVRERVLLPPAAGLHVILLLPPSLCYETRS